jgi:uncharacterized membrane protein YcaP (DUF421 family)
MDAVISAAVIFIFLVVLFRIVGKRMVAQLTTFDLLLLLIISEATQQGLLGQDYSLTNAFLVILTLVGLNLLMEFLAYYSRWFDRWFNGLPLVIIEDGQLIDDRMKKERLDENEVLEYARQSHGIERMDQIKYAVLERNGAISIIPKQSG